MLIWTSSPENKRFLSKPCSASHWPFYGILNDSLMVLQFNLGTQQKFCDFFYRFCVDNWPKIHGFFSSPPDISTSRHTFSGPNPGSLPTARTIRPSTKRFAHQPTDWRVPFRLWYLPLEWGQRIDASSRTQIHTQWIGRALGQRYRGMAVTARTCRDF